MMNLLYKLITDRALYFHTCLLTDLITYLPSYVSIYFEKHTSVNVFFSSSLCLTLFITNTPFTLQVVCPTMRCFTLWQNHLQGCNMPSEI